MNHISKKILFFVILLVVLMLPSILGFFYPVISILWVDVGIVLRFVGLIILGYIAYKFFRNKKEVKEKQTTQ